MRAHIWSFVIWAALFCHTLFTQMDSPEWACVTPLYVLLGIVLALTVFIYKAGPNLHYWLPLLGWLFMSTVVLILRTHEVVYNAFVVTVLFLAVTFFAATVRCFMKTPFSPEWDRYVSIQIVFLSIFLFFTAINPNAWIRSHWYVLIGVFFVLANIWQYYQVVSLQENNVERCTLIWRMTAYVTGAVFLLVVYIAHPWEGDVQTEYYIIAFQLYIMLVILIDAIRSQIVPQSTYIDSAEYNDDV